MASERYLTAMDFDRPQIPTFDVVKYLTTKNQVKIAVGVENKAFYLNEDLACSASPYFRAMFSGGFKEGQTKETQLLEFDAQVFGHVVKWMYGQGLQCLQCKEDHYFSKRKNDAKRDNHALAWCQLWVLADYLGMMSLRDTALHQYSSCLDGTLPSIDEIDYICNNSPEESNLHLYTLEKFVDDFFEVTVDNTRSNKYWADTVAANKEFCAAVWHDIRSHCHSHGPTCPRKTCYTHLKRGGKRVLKMHD